MSDQKHYYDSPAGGWGALKSSMKHLKKEGIARGTKAMLKANQHGGFDCPGCAWPEPNKPSMTEFCENGVKAITWETTKKRTTRAFFAEHTLKELESWSHYDLEAHGRLTEPHSYDAASDKYTPISWEDAFSLIAKELKQLDSPDEAAFYTSGRTSNEAAFLYQLFGRAFGTNNFPDCSNLCHESSGVAMSATVGIGKGTVTIDDFEKADAIFVFGQNPGTNHPRMLSELQGARRHGSKVLSFNPLVEKGLETFVHPQEVGAMLTNKGSEISSHYYQVKIGGDQAAIQAMIQHVLKRDAEQGGGILDREFIEQHCQGFEQYQQHILAQDWQVLVSESGLAEEQIIEAAEVYIAAKSTICCWAMGLTQQLHAVGTIQDVVALLLLKGNMGRPGAGACPVRGHSNVQGDRTMGIYEKPSPAFLDGLQKAFEFDPPREHGYDAVEAIEAMQQDKVKVFMAMGGNFAAATPDTEVTEAALRKCKLTVQVSTKLNRSHIVHGEQALILPCLGRSEIDLQKSGAQRVTVEDSMSMVHSSGGVISPASTLLKSEPAIVAGVAQAVLGNFPVKWTELIGNYDLIRDAIESAMPAIFPKFNQRLQQKGGFRLPNCASDRTWNGGKANFISTTIPKLELPEGQLRLMTTRTHDQYNTTIYSYEDRYRGISGIRTVILMNKHDLETRGLVDGDKVTITSHAKDGKERKVTGFTAYEYNIPVGSTGAFFPETNVLVPLENTALLSNTPMSKFIPITVVKE